jgi:hypothetical protein
LNHHATPDFWTAYCSLSTTTQQLADRAYALLKRDPRHPSLRLKNVGRYWSVRVGDHYRALAIEVPDGLVWFWIKPC